MAGLFPDAPIYTSFYAPGSTYPEFADLDVRTTSLQSSIRPDHFRRSVLRLPGAFAGLDLSGFDQVLVSSSAFAHHIRHPRSVVYCYAPPHFLYDSRAYFGSRAKAAAAWPVLAPLRRRDRTAASSHGAYIAISAESARRIASAYGRTAPIVYPPLRTEHLPLLPEPLPAEPRALIVARMLPYKRVDVALSACVQAGVGLTVVGEGPEEPRLRQLAAGHDVQFLGRLDDAALVDLFVAHSLVLAPGIEDFGYGPVEANYAGRPVVAQAAGGALETVENGVNGILVSGWDTGHWADAIKSAVHRSWSPAALRESTSRFHADEFGRGIRNAMDSV